MRRKFLGPIFLGLMICLSLALVGIGGFFLAGCTKEKDKKIGAERSDDPPSSDTYTVSFATTQIGGAAAPERVYYSVATDSDGTYSSEQPIYSPNGKSVTINEGYVFRFRTYYSGVPSETAFVASNHQTYDEEGTQLLHPGMTGSSYSDYMYVENVQSDITLTIYSVKRMNRIKLNLAGATYDDYQAYTDSTYSGVKFTEIDTGFDKNTSNADDFSLTKRGSTYWDGWFRSNHHFSWAGKGRDSVVTMKMTFIVPTTMTLTFQYFVQSEAGFDRVWFSNIDTPFTYPSSGSNEPTSTYKALLESGSGTYGTVSYTNVSAGEHTIYVKYKKDSSDSCGADGICFRPLFNYVYGTGADDVIFCYPQNGDGQFNYFRVGRVSKAGNDFNGWYAYANGGTPQRAGAAGADLAISSYSSGYWNGEPATSFHAYFTPAVIGITLEQSSASTTGTSAVYYRYGTNAYYSNSTLTTQISSITAPWKYGHDFNGFFTQPNGAGTQYINDSGGFTNSLYSYDGSGGTTLYAYFDPRDYEVDFYPMGATTITTNGLYQWSTSYYADFDCGTVYRISDYVTEISRTGYHFDGWLITSYSSGEYALVGASTSSMTEYDGGIIPNNYYFKDLRPNNYHYAVFEAQWTANTYTVTADANGGTFSTPLPSGWSGSGSTRTKSIEYGGQYGTLPTVTKSNYTFDGWHMTNTSGATISSATTMNTASAHTLMAKWNATPRTITITAYTYSYTGTGANGLPSGASLGISYKWVSGGVAYNANVTQTIASDSYTMHQGTSCSVTPVVPTGYVFAGMKYGSVNGTNYDYSFSVPNSDTTYYAVFQEAKVELQYDAGELYYYYEDGYYPQSYVGNDLNTTLNNASSPALASAGWSINVGYSTLNVYSYFGNYYVKVQAPRTMTISLGSGSHSSGTSYSFTSNAWYWFKVEPIRWRVSDYGGSPAQLLADYGWEPGQAFYNIVGISDILGYDRLSSQPSNFVLGDNATEGNIVQSQTYGTGLGFALGTGESASSMVTLDSDLDTFNSTGNATKVSQASFAWDQRASSNDKLIAASLRDIDKVTQNLTMYASDFSAFMMGCDFDKATGWTRNLYNLGSYYAITPGGTRTEAWCDQYYGYVFAHQAYQVVTTRIRS